jgi:hypothetical protein
VEDLPIFFRLAEKNIVLAETHRELGQAIVYVRVKKLRASRIEGLSFQVI